MKLPEITQYVDFRVFLKAWMQAKRDAEPGYSYARFAAEGGCSRSALANVLNGNRTPRPSTLDAFAQAMKLTPWERNYLGVLVDMNQAPDLPQRELAMKRLLALSPNRTLDPGTASRGFLDHWYVPAIYELARLNGFQDDPEWIARTLCPPILVAEARAGLELLLDLGFLRRKPDGVYVEGIRTGTADETNNHAVARYHREVIPELLQRLDTSRGHEQHLLAATLVLPKVLVEECKLRLQMMAAKMATAADATNTMKHAEPVRVYQLSVQLLPLSEPIS